MPLTVMRLLSVLAAYLAFVLRFSGAEDQTNERYEPVALVQKVNSNSETSVNEEREKPIIRATPREVRDYFMKMHGGIEEGRGMEENDMVTAAMPSVDYESEEGKSYEDGYDENDDGYDQLDGTEAEIVPTEIETSSQQNTTGSNRTKLYPIGRLWERSPVDFWSVINAAFSCLWSGLGLECFSFKVVPMVKSLMGYQPMFLPPPFENPYFVSPRGSENNDSKQQGENEDKTEPIAETDDSVPRKRKHTTLKLAKWALYGFAAAKTFIVPLLSALSLVSGKALVFSLLAGTLTLAIAWNGLFGQHADRRVYETESQSSYYPYSTLHA